MRKIIVSGFLSADAKRQISKQNREFITFSISNSEYNDAKDASGALKHTGLGLRHLIIIISLCHSI